MAKDTPKDEYAFKDPSDLIIHVKHISVPLTLEDPYGKSKTEILQQPSSQISVEVPANAALSWQEVYEAFTGEKPPADYKPRDGNRLILGTAAGMIQQISLIGQLSNSKLFEEATVDKVNKCCNHPTPAVGATR